MGLKNLKAALIIDLTQKKYSTSISLSICALSDKLSENLHSNTENIVRPGQNTLQKSVG